MSNIASGSLRERDGLLGLPVTAMAPLPHTGNDIVMMSDWFAGTLKPLLALWLDVGLEDFLVSFRQLCEARRNTASSDSGSSDSAPPAAAVTCSVLALASGQNLRTIHVQCYAKLHSLAAMFRHNFFECARPWPVLVIGITSFCGIVYENCRTNSLHYDVAAGLQQPLLANRGMLTVFCNVSRRHQGLFDKYHLYTSCNFLEHTGRAKLCLPDAILNGLRLCYACELRLANASINDNAATILSTEEAHSFDQNIYMSSTSVAYAVRHNGGQGIKRQRSPN